VFLILLATSLIAGSFMITLVTNFFTSGTNITGAGLAAGGC
jgi:hypothetical protein